MRKGISQPSHPKNNDNSYHPMSSMTPSNASKPLPVQKETKGVFLIPNNVACEGATTVAVVFDESPEFALKGSCKVEVLIRIPGQNQRIEATRVNERTFIFKAPENREGEFPAEVIVNGKEASSTFLRYKSDTESLVTDLGQIYLEFMSTVCKYLYHVQSKHQIPSPMPDLDRLLADSFDHRGSQSIPPRAFEELFDSLRHSSAETMRSSYEIPTVIHLAAEYGLEQFARKLMDLPGSTRAINLLNSKGRTASEIALNNGYKSLSTALDLQHTQRPEIRKSSRTPRDSTKVETIFPACIPSQRTMKREEPRDDGIYMKPNSSENDDDDTYSIFPSPKPTHTIPCERNTPQSTISRPPVPLSRRCVAPPPPSVSRPESRDSGTYEAGDHYPPALPPPFVARVDRPPFSRSDTVPGNRKSDEPRASNFSGNEIVRQLSKIVPAGPPSATKGLSKTK